MKRVLPLLLLAFLLTGCSENISQSSGGLTPDEVFSGGSVQIEGYEKPSNMIEISSQQLVTNIRIGWNIGKSLESCYGDIDGDGIADYYTLPGQVPDETFWGNPAITEQLFRVLADSGINAVRLPVTWRDHTDADGKIDDAWLNRVQQVVDYAYDCGMYVIITMYHDGADDVQNGAWLRNAAYDKSGVISKYKAVWTQIAERFITYNERILYESMNDVEFPELSKDEAYDLFNSINQEFVTTVRSTGGNNVRRHLVISGYGADISGVCDRRFRMPEDITNKCILSVQYYIPRTYCLENIHTFWGSQVEEKWMESRVELLRTNFVDKGIPVIISEYGVRSDSDNESRVYFCEKLAKICKNNYISSFIWDDGDILDRKTCEWKNPELLMSLKRATSGNSYVPDRHGETAESEEQSMEALPETEEIIIIGETTADTVTIESIL